MSKSLRLYRELSRISKNDRNTEDATFEKERNDVLHMLGYKVKGIEELIKAPKNHGKLARRAVNDRLKHGANKKEALVTKVNQMFNDAMTLADQDLSMLREVRGHIMKNERIPESLVNRTTDRQKLNLTTTRDAFNSSPTADYALSNSGFLPPIIVDTRNLKQSVVSGTPVYHLPTPVVGRGGKYCFNNNFTTYKWSRNERTKLNELYLEIPKPTNNSEDSWDNFFFNISARFSAFYPKRSDIEIRTKLNDMLHKRQLKQKGEAEYWDESVLQRIPVK